MKEMKEMKKYNLYFCILLHIYIILIINITGDILFFFLIIINELL